MRLEGRHGQTSANPALAARSSAAPGGGGGISSDIARTNASSSSIRNATLWRFSKPMVEMEGYPFSAEVPSGPIHPCVVVTEVIAAPLHWTPSAPVKLPTAVETTTRESRVNSTTKACRLAGVRRQIRQMPLAALPKSPAAPSDAVGCGTECALPLRPSRQARSGRHRLPSAYGPSKQTRARRTVSDR